MSSVELERVCVQGVPDIQEAAAVGVPSPGGGPEQLVLFVVPCDAGAARSNPKIKAQCQAAIRAKLNPLFKVDRVSLSLPSLTLVCCHCRLQHAQGAGRLHRHQ